MDGVRRLVIGALSCGTGLARLGDYADQATLPRLAAHLAGAILPAASGPLGVIGTAGRVSGLAMSASPLGASGQKDP
jgi:hypothetical protein